MPLSEASRAKAQELVERYPEPRSAMLPLLFLVQAEDGYVSPEGVREVADLLGATRAEVGAVATFYTMFRRRPSGQFVLSVCRTLSCQMRGSDDVTAALLEHLDLELGGTTPDGRFTVEEVECLAACDGAPVLQVNSENYERVTAKEAVGLADALRSGEIPAPTFASVGSVTEPSSRAVSWRLAGLGEPPADLNQPAPAFTSRQQSSPVTGMQGDGPGVAGRPSATGTQQPGGGGTGVEAERPQPDASPDGEVPPDIAREAGPDQREQPGGEPQ